MKSLVKTLVITVLVASILAVIVSAVVLTPLLVSADANQTIAAVDSANAAPVLAQTANVNVAEAATIYNYSDIYNRVSPSVVAISVLSNNNGEIGGGSGTGFVIDTNGHIVTNNHVVAGGERIEVSFFDGTLARANIVGLDPDSDIAVIQVDIPAAQLTPVTFGNSDALLVGEPVLALGSPFGQRWTLTAGIVSALERSIRGLAGFSIGGVIQTDAAINPGNSGGPLLNVSGHVIGVNTQMLSDSRSSSGVGFAVPGNLVQRVANALIQTGRVNYSYIGISGGDVSLALIEALNMPNNMRGVVVSDVVGGGPAANAGLHSAGNAVNIDGFPVPRSVDVITAVNGTPITGMDGLIAYLARNTQPGQTVRLSVLRDGQQNLEVDLLLAARQ